MPNNPLNLLLIEDDSGIARAVQAGLDGAGFTVRWARSAEAAAALLSHDIYRAIILDAMLPDDDGFALCARLRGQGLDTPIIMLTARDTLDDKLAGFAAGADDYLTKPFAIDELAVRLLAVCRRRNATPSADRHDEITVGDLCIKPSARELLVGNKPVPLTRREFDVLLCLAERASTVVSRQQLLQRAWQDSKQINLNTVDVYINYLRKKLSHANSAVDIQTARGIGFKLS